VATLPRTLQLAYAMVNTHIVQYYYLSILIRDHVMHPNTLVQLINIVSNLIFQCNNCDANRAFVTIRERTAAAPSSGLLNAKFTLKGTSPTNHLYKDS